MEQNIIVLLFVALVNLCNSQPQDFKLVSIVDSSLIAIPSWLEEAIGMVQAAANSSKISNEIVAVAIDDETAAQEKFCQAMYKTVSMILDVTAGGWWYARQMAEKFGIPYVHAQISIYPWMAATDQFLQSRNGTDAALIFSNEAQLDQALYYLVEGSVIRVIVLAGIHGNTSDSLKKMRPAPAHYVLFANSDDIADMFDQAVRIGLVTRDSRWLLMTTSQNTTAFPRQLIPTPNLLTLMTPKDSICCVATASSAPCSCSKVEVQRDLTTNSVLYSVRALRKSKFGLTGGDCNVFPASIPSRQTFYDAMVEELVTWPGVNWTQSKQQITPKLELTIRTLNLSIDNSVGEWSTDNGLALNPEFQNTKIKRYFRVGTIRSKPWMYDKEQEAGTPGVPQLDGYCVELTKKLSEQMIFDYEFIFPSDGKYGGRTPNGTWNGLVGDLANGATDIIVAPLTMTSEREEVIDFVAPYFDQSGISIVIRKREREESLFKFMTVLKPEVWVSIVAALVVTGVMLWFLDKYSPYSAQNNAEFLAQNYRKFTLKESFWFALTSFTPQGGGEAPKALSGRTLVAAYWLFVVLMLATFTANLAAFLTVERMQSPIQSLEALAGQAKIGFTTTKDTSIYEYFYNMAKAEDELFRVWKELTLNSTNDQSKYRVWDYPIKEQYTHILQVIDDTGPLVDAQAGINKVMESKDGDFAFIHDASELRYEVYHNCFLTEVGEPFAEQPYAIAVQQGSHLQDEISRAILELQKDRYFEALTAKFWNSSAKGMCPNENDSEGINLQSLGGVFIATLVGLVLALVALGVEVMYYRHVPPEKAKESGHIGKGKFGALKKSTISRINVSPAF